MGYKKNDGILKYTDFENIAARVNSTFNVSKAVSVGENFTHTHQAGRLPADGKRPENANDSTGVRNRRHYLCLSGRQHGRPKQNPLRELAFNKDNALNIWRLFGNAFIDIRPVKGLTLRSNFGLDYDAAFIHSYNYTFHSDIVNNDTNSTTLSQANDSKYVPPIRPTTASLWPTTIR